MRSRSGLLPVRLTIAMGLTAAIVLEDMGYCWMRTTGKMTAIVTQRSNRRAQQEEAALLPFFFEVQFTPQDLLHGLECIQKCPILDDPVVVEAKKMRGKQADRAFCRPLRQLD
jgi:hypothetical protein